MRPEDYAPPKSDNPEVLQMKSAFNAFFEISNGLNTNLSPEALKAAIRLCELGIQPDVLAKVIKEIRAKIIEKKMENCVQIDREPNDGNRNI